MNFCNDNDECELGTHDCAVNANCVNIVGDYACDCKPGYEHAMDYLGNGCRNFDECAEFFHDCDAAATCTDTDPIQLPDGNTEPGFICTCPAGWSGDGKSCSQIDCSTTFNCNQSRGACGGSLFVNSADYETDLISCLAGFTEEEIQFNGRSFAAKRRKYYKEIDGDSFIWYDQSYEIWRLGGGSEPTVTVNCATVPICN